MQHLHVKAFFTKSISSAFSITPLPPKCMCVLYMNVSGVKDGHLHKEVVVFLMSLLIDSTTRITLT